MRFMQSLNEIKYFLLDHLLMMLVVYIIHPSINDKDFRSFLSINPFLMSLVDSFKIIHTDIFFTLSISNLDPRMTNLWGTLQVNNPFNGTMLD